MKKYLGIGFWLLFVFTITSNAQSLKIETSVNKKEIKIGDDITCTLKVTYNPSDYFIQKIQIPDTFHGFELVSQAKTDTIAQSSNIVTQSVFHFTHFDSGYYFLPPFPIHCKGKNSISDTVLFSDSIGIMVNTIPVDTTQPIKPIYAIRDAKMPLTSVLKYVLIVALLLAILVFLIIYFYKKYKNKPQVKKEEIKSILPPYEQAIQDLQNILQNESWKQYDTKTFYTLWSDILRKYLEEQFHIDCFEKTSSEIISQARKMKELANSRQSMRNLFDTADMVKFAKANPDTQTHIQCVNEAITVVKESYKKVKQTDNKPTDSQ